MNSFHLVDYSFVDNTARLHYAFDDGEQFVETFEFPSNDALDARPSNDTALKHLVFLLFLAAGVSYYKLFVPSQIVVDRYALTDTERQWMYSLYSYGLGEFAFKNNIPIPRPEIHADVEPGREPIDTSLDEIALVAVGGGKDSCVSIDILASANYQTLLGSVNTATPIEQVIKVAQLPSIQIKRQLAPRLFELNANAQTAGGAGRVLNGHVPVTAIVSLAMCIGATLNKCRYVVMSNERSASVGNRDYDGTVINHQFSKSLQAERMLANVIAPTGIKYFSLLRPLSELEIARRFSLMSKYHHAFTSCNRAFHINHDIRINHWCCDCPKCRFVFLIMAPFNSPSHLIDIFGTNLLDDVAQASGFDELMQDKPFECVGELEESIAAFQAISQSQQWLTSSCLVRRFASSELSTQRLDIDSFYDLSTEHNVPEQFLLMLKANQPS